jgi:hypothetical protein
MIHKIKGVIIGSCFSWRAYPEDPMYLKEVNRHITPIKVRNTGK